MSRLCSSSEDQKGPNTFAPFASPFDLQAGRVLSLGCIGRTVVVKAVFRVVEAFPTGGCSRPARCCHYLSRVDRRSLLRIHNNSNRRKLGSYRSLVLAPLLLSFVGCLSLRQAPPPARRQPPGRPPPARIRVFFSLPSSDRSSVAAALPHRAARRCSSRTAACSPRRLPLFSPAGAFSSRSPGIRRGGSP